MQILTPLSLFTAMIAALPGLSSVLILFFVLQPPTPTPLTPFQRVSGFLPDDGQYHEVQRIGRGSVQTMQVHPNGTQILVTTATGGWVYDYDGSNMRDAAHLENLLNGRYSPDGHFIASMTPSNNIALWSSNALVAEGVLSGHEAAIQKIDWHPAGGLLASLDTDGTIIVWDVTTHQRRQTLHHANADDIAWSPGGGYLAANNQSGEMVVWRALGDVILQPTPDSYRKHNFNILWQSETQLFQTYIQSELSIANLWNVVDGTYAVINNQVSSLSNPSPDGSRIATRKQANLKIYALASEGMTEELQFDISHVLSLEWSTNGRWLATQSWQQKNRITILNTTTGGIQNYFDVDEEATIRGLIWMGASENFLVLDSIGQIYQGDINSNGLSLVNRDHTLIGETAAWRDDGEVIAVARQNNGGTIWNPVTGEDIRWMPYPATPITHFAWQPGGNLLASAGGDDRNVIDRTIRVWDVTTERATLDYEIPAARSVADFAWSPDGETLGVLDNSANYIRLWQPAQRETMRVIAPWPDREFTGNAANFHWNPNTNLINFTLQSSGNGGFFYFLDTMTSEIIEPDVLTSYASAWDTTTNGVFYGTNWGTYGCGGAAPEVIDLEMEYTNLLTNERTTGHTLTGLQAQVRRARFSPNGQYLFGVDAEDNAILWDVATGAAIRSFTGASDVTWSPDSMLLYLYYADGRQLILDAATGDTLQEMTRHRKTTRIYDAGELIVKAYWTQDSSKLAVLDEGVLFIYETAR